MKNTQDIYKLKSANNFYVELSSLGAAIKTIYTPDKKGRMANVALCPIETSQNRSGTYAGAVVGPVAGRVSGANIKIDNKQYALSQNDGANNLHGGFDGLATKKWSVIEFVQENSKAHIIFETMLADGQDGFPGNRTFRALYSVDKNMCLSLKLSAVSDKKTYVDLTSHLYVNLSGDFRQTINEHQLQINASQVCTNNQEHLPEKIIDVDNTSFDFRKPTQIGNYLNNLPIELSRSKGYNNAFLLDKSSEYIIDTAAIISDNKTGRRLEIQTTASSLVVYSGGFFTQDLELKGNVHASPSCAIALEAQSVPDCPNFLPSKAIFLEAGEQYSSEIRFKFSVC